MLLIGKAKWLVNYQFSWVVRITFILHVYLKVKNRIYFKVSSQENNFIKHHFVHKIYVLLILWKIVCWDILASVAMKFFREIVGPLTVDNGSLNSLWRTISIDWTSSFKGVHNEKSNKGVGQNEKIKKRVKD